MTAAEKQRFIGYFPALNVNQAVVTGEISRVYNCIAWTVGVTNQWLWPGASLSNFDVFYRRFGLVRSANGNVAAWGHATNNMTHGCISGPGHGPRWESKCGSDLRIQHGLNELVGNSYGRVIAFYTRARILKNEAEEIIKQLMQQPDELTSDEKASLKEQVEQVPQEIANEFEQRFADWKGTWFSDRLSIDSNPASRSNSIQFFRLLDMGDAIVPLVIEKLADSENFFALQLYERLQVNPALKLEIDVEDDTILEGEQGRAFRTVVAYLRNK